MKYKHTLTDKVVRSLADFLVFFNRASQRGFPASFRNLNVSHINANFSNVTYDTEALQLASRLNTYSVRLLVKERLIFIHIVLDSDCGYTALLHRTEPKKSHELLY